MAAKPANAVQKKWMSDIAEWANDGGIDLLFGIEYPSSIQLHHVLGRSAKHNKIAIGHEFIIPLPFELHDVSSNEPDNVTHHKKVFTSKHGSQASLFLKMVQDMEEGGFYVVPDVFKCLAIKESGA
jgi:hypothetical protein